MSQVKHENAPVGHTLAHVRTLLREAEALCRAVAGRDLGTTPLYLVPQSSLPAQCGSGKCCLAYTTPSLDLYMQEHIAAWRGRGPCMVINDIAMAEEYEPADLEFAMKAHSLHELAHILVRPQLFEERPDACPNKILFESLVVAAATERMPSADLPVYFGHEAEFIRTVLHLCHRAARIGFDVRPSLLCAGYRYSLFPAQRYQQALGHEPEHCVEMFFRDILATQPPSEFTALWADDMQRHHDCSQVPHFTKGSEV